ERFWGNLQQLGLRGFTTLIQAKESNSKTLKPATFENLTTLELSKRYNARLSGCQRNTTATALRLKHNYYCKPKMPRVGSPLEAFVSILRPKMPTSNSNNEIKNEQLITKYSSKSAISSPFLALNRFTSLIACSSDKLGKK
ncbi:hypothetical protein, partial [Vibrio penaeicida]|uniref:hypothetical protein n=1 Tax=Vibrio penaeicida TaxID=104609 RepID=UPI001F2C6089